MRLFTCLTTFQPQSRCPVTAAFSQTCLWGILQDLSNQTLRLVDSLFSPILTQSSPSRSSTFQSSGWSLPQNVKLRDGEQEGLVLKNRQLVTLIFGNRQTKNVFTTVKPLFERWAVLPQPLALFFCVSQRDPEHVLECSHPFSYVLLQERLDRKCWWEKQYVFCVRDHVNWCMRKHQDVMERSQWAAWTCGSVIYLLLSAVYANQISSSMSAIISGLFPTWTIIGEIIALASKVHPAVLTVCTWLSFE